MLHMETKLQGLCDLNMKSDGLVNQKSKGPSRGGIEKQRQRKLEMS